MLLRGRGTESSSRAGLGQVTEGFGGRGCAGARREDAKSPFWVTQCGLFEFAHALCRSEMWSVSGNMSISSRHAVTKSNELTRIYPEQAFAPLLRSKWIDQSTAGDLCPFMRGRSFKLNGTGRPRRSGAGGFSFIRSKWTVSASSGLAQWR
jgi:hypothetical protein